MTAQGHDAQGDRESEPGQAARATAWRRFVGWQELIWDHHPRWQKLFTGFTKRRLARSGLFSPDVVCEIEYRLARVLGQPLSPRQWDKMTFNDKVYYRQLRVHDPMHVVFSDKLRMREHVTSILGKEAVPALLRAGERAEDFRDLVGPFALKANHGSGWVFLVDTPRKLTDQEVSLAGSWLKLNYGTTRQEWAYRFARPLVLAEEFLEPGPPKDYKFYVFDGEVAAITVDSDRFGAHYRSLLRPDWSPLGRYLFPPPPTPDAEPPNLGTMLEWASALGAGIDFVRVDMYDLGDRVFVGELTCYPASAEGRFRPASLDAWLGSQWKRTARLEEFSRDGRGRGQR